MPKSVADNSKENEMDNASLALEKNAVVESSISQSGSSHQWSESPVQQSDIILSNDQINEYIILAVQNEPCLWNYRINVQERSKAKIDAAYESIAEQLGYRLTKEEVKKRWQDLQQKYKSVRAALRGYRPSGSAAIPPSVENSIKKSFEYYDSMEFLNDTCDPAL